MREFRAALAFAAMTVVLASPAAAQRNNWGTPTEPFHIIDNVYYVGT